MSWMLNGKRRLGMAESGISDTVRASIAVPDVVDSPWGELRFFDGVPSLQSIDMIYDMLDLLRGIEVYLNTIPGRRWSPYARASAASAWTG